jgi:hypothetical protein
MLASPAAWRIRKLTSGPNRVEITKGRPVDLWLHTIDYTLAGRAAANRTTYPTGWPPFGVTEPRTWGPSKMIYWAKIGFEKWWLWRYF